MNSTTKSHRFAALSLAVVLRSVVGASPASCADSTTQDEPTALAGRAGQANEESGAGGVGGGGIERGGNVGGGGAGSGNVGGAGHEEGQANTGRAGGQGRDGGEAVTTGGKSGSGGEVDGSSAGGSGANGADGARESSATSAGGAPADGAPLPDAKDSSISPGDAGGANVRSDAGDSGSTKPITVWMAGDSTMANPSGSCPVGWGSRFQAQFTSNAKVINNAVSGTTVRSWLYDVTSTLGTNGDCNLASNTPQARWTQISNGMKSGDYLFIQFGINDTTSASCPKHVSYATFKELLGMMATTANDKGAHPIFLTPVSSISCMGAQAQGTRGGYANATKEAGAQYSVPVIDLEQLSVGLYTTSGFCPSTDDTATFAASTPIGRFFCNDHTHFEAEGAEQIAALVAKALRTQQFELAAYLARSN